MWQLFLFVYFIFGSSTYILRKILAQRFGEHIRIINAFFYLFFLLPGGMLLSFFYPHNFNVGVVNLILLFGGGIIWPISSLIALRANRHVDAGIYAIITNLSPLFTLAVALPFLHESLSSKQYFGVTLLIASGVLAAGSQLHKRNRSDMSGILTCLLSAAVIGVAIVYERFMLNRIDFGAYLIYGWGSQVVWALAIAGKRLKALPEFFNNGLKASELLIFFGITSLLRSIGFILALKLSGSASLISASTDFMSVAVLVAAYFFLREREHMIYKWLATAVGIAGLLFIAK